MLTESRPSMVATYRLQLQPDFGFAEVEALLPYFRKLGISHLYLSPITEARAGSSHGYDVVDHNTVRSEFGGREGFDRLLRAARDAGLQLILDFVPNHAGVGPHNAYWQDVLAYGPHSPYAHYFDIDWAPLKETLQNKVLLPFLGRPYGEALDDGEITLTYEDERFSAAYYDNRFALSPASYADILSVVLRAHERTDVYFDLKDLQEAYATLKPGERQKAEVLNRRLTSLAEQVDLSASLDAFKGEKLHELLEQQFWRLAYWKTAGYEINYRRFFDINGLVALRMEDETVFWDVHRLLGELVTQEGVAGARIDHIDGLFDPRTYLERLRELGARRIWVEKILAPGETLPEGWPVEGTTGYEFLNDVMGVLLHPEGEYPLQRTYRRFVPKARSFEDEVHESKVLVMETSLSSELFRLAYQLNRISEIDYHTRDFTLSALRGALAEVVAALNRYRTYLPHEEEEARDVVRETIHRARSRNPAYEPSVFEFIAQVVLGDVREDVRPHQTAWTGRFQQYTAPVAAKGVEDTTFYRYLPLVALNEVGGEPEPFGQSVQAFHAHARFRAQRYPLNLLATATHDHKRGEDTRMRLIVLAEVPELWEQTVRALSEIAAPYRRLQGPSKFDEYLFYQVLAALWHGSDHTTLPDRLWTYMQKASRESKRNTSWINPDAVYEETLEEFVRGVVSDERTAEALDPLARLLAAHGFFNSLSQLVLKFTTPGIPDVYQGSELLDLTLVDPDNRRPVDYERRKKLLDDFYPLLEHPNADTLRLLLDQRDETAKFYMLARLLRLRQEHTELFLQGTYQPLDVEGTGTDHWIAFARKHKEMALVVAVPRFPATWSDRCAATIPLPEELHALSWKDVLSGTTLSETTYLDTTTFGLPWNVLLSS